jgi:hypothetical protein
MEETKMNQRIVALVIGVFLLASPAFAGDVDGRWTGTMSTLGGEFPITFVFKGDGGTLTGYMIGMEGGQIPIVDGKIDGDKISYNVTVDFGGMSLRMLYKGIVSSDEIKFDVSIFDITMAVVVKKQKT